MKFDRRDLLKFVGGSAAGVLLSPVPWKLLDDAAIWSQNWSWIPRPLQGEIRVKHTTCTLCPAGCAMRARCVGDQPFALVGAAGDALCPAGLCAHQLAHVPQRPAQPVPHVTATPPVAILDLRPGRTASLAYRAIAAHMKAIYVTPPAIEGATLEAVAELAGEAVGFDFSHVKTLVSIGTPVLEGWGTPSRILRRKREGMRIIQVERRQSRTAMMADEWIPSDGIPAELVSRVSSEGPALFIADGDPTVGPPSREVVRAAAALSLRLGSAAIVRRRETPHPAGLGELAPVTPLAAVADGSVQTLFVDEGSVVTSLPWRLIARKLRSDACVVAMTASAHGMARHAHAVAPAATFLEALDDAPVATDSAVATFRVSMPLLPQPRNVVTPVEFLARIAGMEMKLATLLEQRAAAIQSQGRGEVMVYASGEKQAAKGQDLWKLIGEGAAWMDEAGPSGKWPTPAAPQLEWTAAHDAQYPLALVAHGYRGDITSPMLRKLDQESDLRPAFGEARIHPQTAGRYGVTDGSQAYVETTCGSCRLKVRLDDAVAPGTLEAACGPHLADVCEINADGTWGASRARIQRA